MCKQSFRSPSDKNVWYMSSKDIEEDIPNTLPYRHKDLVASKLKTVYIVEGEKCADAVIKLGLNATTALNPNKSITNRLVFT